MMENLPSEERNADCDFPARMSVIGALYTALLFRKKIGSLVLFS
jgi:hypothetical protein